MRTEMCSRKMLLRITTPASRGSRIPCTPLTAADWSASTARPSNRVQRVHQPAPSPHAAQATPIPVAPHSRKRSEMWSRGIPGIDGFGEQEACRLLINWVVRARRGGFQINRWRPSERGTRSGKILAEHGLARSTGCIQTVK